MVVRAGRFYGPSIDFSGVTVQLTRVAIGRRPWTANNTIRLVAETPEESSNRASGAAGERGHNLPGGAGTAVATLVHELAHVWQYQNGNLQLWRGVIDQANYWLGRNPYDYGGAAGIRAAVTAGRPLTSFSNESQAQILQDYWSALNLTEATGYRKEPFTPGYVEDLRALVEGAGVGTRPPTGANSLETAAGRVVNRVAGWLEAAMGALVG